MRPYFILLATLLLGCDLFPEELYMNADAAVDAGEPGLELAETCGPGAPVVDEEGLNDVVIDLSGLEDDVRGVEACTGRATPGADGFFAVEMEDNEKWHFHVRSSEGLDPAIYILDSACDERRCGTGDAIDVCDDGRDEHLSFLAPRQGTYYIGVDSRLNVDATYQLVAIRPTCGDGALEHSETCDDSNTEDGDGCDSLCRVELDPMSTEEQEPNDDYTGANVLHLDDDDTLSVTGTLAGPCDTDLYLIELESAMTLNVEMRTAAGAECPTDTPMFSLRLLDDTASTEQGVGARTETNGCPVMNLADLRAGTYLIAVRSNPDVNVRDYSLAISLTSS